MRTPIIAGNWKMNTTVAEASALVTEMKQGLERIAGVDKVLCPPFISPQVQGSFPKYRCFHDVFVFVGVFRELTIV